jgi:Retrotransposon gag protein
MAEDLMGKLVKEDNLSVKNAAERIGEKSAAQPVVETVRSQSSSKREEGVASETYCDRSLELLQRAVNRPMSLNGVTKKFTSFLVQFKNFADGLRIPTPDRLVVLKMFLTGDALEWFVSFGRTAVWLQNPTYENLRYSFGKAFSNSFEDSLARVELEQLKQTGSLKDYVADFKRKLA